MNTRREGGGNPSFPFLRFDPFRHSLSDIDRISHADIVRGREKTLLNQENEILRTNRYAAIHTHCLPKGGGDIAAPA